MEERGGGGGEFKGMGKGGRCWLRVYIQLGKIELNQF